MTLSAKGAFFELNVLDDQPTPTLDLQTFKEAMLDYRQFLASLKKG